MAIKRQTCPSHPDRPAIGVCVITRQAICAECSTRYEGVNYSKEGLRILRERRAAQAQGAGGRWLWGAVAVVTSPVLLLLLYLYLVAWGKSLIDLAQWEF